MPTRYPEHARRNSAEGMFRPRHVPPDPHANHEVALLAARWHSGDETAVRRAWVSGQSTAEDAVAGVCGAGAEELARDVEVLVVGRVVGKSEA